MEVKAPVICPKCGQQISVEDKQAKVLAQLPERGYVRQKLLIPHLLPFSSATLWRKISDGTFPAPHKLSTRVTAWRIEEVKTWLAESGKAPVRNYRQKGKRPQEN